MRASGLPVLLTLVLNLVVGRLADRARDWRTVIVIGALLGAIFSVGLLFAHGFVGILVVWTLAALPLAAIGPVQDAAALRLTRRNGTDFGSIRAWGTVGYMGVIVLTGQVVTWFGGGAFMPLFVALCVLRGLVELDDDPHGARWTSAAPSAQPRWWSGTRAQDAC